MNYSLTPKTFQVNEIFNPHLSEKAGEYYYYTLEKKGISHKEAVKRIGARAYFCGIKDKNAHTKQWFCTSESVQETTEENFIIKFKGYSNERIHVGKHKGNAFKVIIELPEKEFRALKKFKPKNAPVCNYFGEQRFSENTLEFCKVLEEKKYEDALKIFLTKKSKFDSEKSRAMKKIIEENWGNWKKTLENKEIIGTGKVILFEYLEKNPKNFEEAFNYAEPKSLRILLKAAQSKRFNEKLNELAQEKKPNNLFGEINKEKIAFEANKSFKRSILIEPTEFEKKFRKTPLERDTFFAAEKFKVKKMNEKNTVRLEFELQKGSYATVFLKFLKSWLQKNILQ